MDESLYRLYIIKAKQGYLDSLALAECKDEAVLMNDKYNLLMQQAENWNSQLISNTEQLNKSLSENAKLKDSSRIKSFAIILLGVVSTILIIK